MSVNINYCDTFLNAVLNSYTAGSFVRTLGFFAPGDGGAAVYKISQELPDADKTISTTVAGVTFTYGEGKFYKTNSTVFELIPQGNTVYAEQFGVFPGGESYAVNNILLLKKAIAFATENSCVLTFASGGVYNLNPGSISVPSGMHIDGNGATLCVIGGSGNSKDYISLFNSKSLVYNVTIKNITLIGRKTSVESGYSDQAIHINCNNLTVRNVRFKFFGYAFHTYGGKSVDEIKIESKTYVINDIPNRNWLIDSCKTENCVFGINTSEIDGLIIKDSDISCFLDTKDTYHCVYLSSNCLNVRVAGCSLNNVSGDAIHKAYAYPSNNAKFDSSKNHFYTDLSIHNADSALDIGIISQNVMCDNVFATEVEIALQLSGADNCIVSNSSFSQTRNSSEMKAFIYAENACNCWMQNSYAYYKGKHRVTSIYYPSAYVYDMFVDKKHRRMYIGSDFKVPNNYLKFTGCEFFSTHVDANRYFYERYNSVVDSKLQKNPTLSQYGEYWDNCSLFVATKQEVFSLNCINDLPGGITIRNSYLENIELVDREQLAPFTIGCDREDRDSNYCKNVCPVYPDSCILSAFGKIYPWIRFENNFYAFKFSKNWASNDWSQYIVPIRAVSVEQFVKSTGSYSSDCYKIDDEGKYLSMVDLM